MKKFLASLILAVSLLVPLGSSYAVYYTDVPASEYGYYNKLEILAKYSDCLGADVIEGYPDGSFRPYNNLTREEAAKIIAKIRGLDSLNYSSFVQFKDMDPNRWSNWYVGNLAGMNIIRGYPDGTFRPTQLVTRAEFARMLFLVMDYAYGPTLYSANYGNYAYNRIIDSYGHWAEDSARYLCSMNVNVDNGTGYFSPDLYIIRGDAASYTAQLLFELIDNYGYSANMPLYGR